MTDAMTATIVCVDDDEDMLASVVRTLRRPDLEVRSTSDPTDALGWIAIGDVAVVVSDYEMPGMNGVELVAAARALCPDTVRVLLTGVGTMDPAIDGINRGEVFRYVRKPFSPSVLRQVVDEAIARHRDLCATAGDREAAIRRARLAVELEQEHPGITRVRRDTAGVYVIPRAAPDLSADLGLNALDIGRR
jgi:DNA-binding NtrC family response regulator